MQGTQRGEEILCWPRIDLRPSNRAFVFLGVPGTVDVEPVPDPLLDAEGTFGSYLQGVDVEFDLTDGRTTKRVATHADVVPSRDLLRQFVNLRDSPPEVVCEFASQWGPLPWCFDHDQPATHSEECFHVVTGASHSNYWEPLSAYRETARRFSLIVDIAEKRLLRSERASVESSVAALWEIFAPAGLTEKIHASTYHYGVETILQFVVNRWLIPTFAFRPTLILPSSSDFGSLQFTSFTPCLLSTLARRVIARLVAPMHRCSACQQLYSQPDGSPAPKSGQRNFCIECRDKGEPKRFADRDSARRRREALKARKAKVMKSKDEDTKKVKGSAKRPARTGKDKSR